MRTRHGPEMDIDMGVPRMRKEVPVAAKERPLTVRRQGPVTAAPAVEERSVDVSDVGVLETPTMFRLDFSSPTQGFLVTELIINFHFSLPPFLVTELIINFHFSSPSVFGHISYHKFPFLFSLRFAHRPYH